jgi:malate synthase
LFSRPADRGGRPRIGPYLYLAKLEGHREARLWNDVLSPARRQSELPTGTIRATVLIETILAAFEMDEILYELRDAPAGLNAGRWDHLQHHQSSASTSSSCPTGQVSMAVPFMRASVQLLVRTCHRRAAQPSAGCRRSSRTGAGPT